MHFQLSGLIPAVRRPRTGGHFAVPKHDFNGDAKIVNPGRGVASGCHVELLHELLNGGVVRHGLLELLHQRLGI